MIAEKGPPPPGAHLAMGADARDQMTDCVANTRDGRMCAHEMLFTR